MSPIHLVCLFEVFCFAGQPCRDPEKDPTVVNLRFSPGMEIAEMWFGRAPQIPWAALQNEAGSNSIHRQISFFVPAPWSGPHLITLDPETQEATLTTHLPGKAWRETGGALDAFSSKGQCAPADDTL
jgi:hypothetical protein